MSGSDTDILSMSDEDILNFEFEDESSAVEADADTGVDYDNEETTDTETDDEVAETEESSPEASDTTDPDEQDFLEEATETSEDSEDADEDVLSIDYKAGYEAVFKPFKANGKEMSVDSPEDAVQLMQMGANYNAKMRDLKPNLKILKSLEANGITDQEQINFLIDLSKRDPAAISKLMNDGELDPMELDMDAGYTANTYEVSDEAMDLNTIVDDLRSSEHYDKLQTLVTEEWDDQSRAVITDSPTLLNTLNDHMSAGIYDQIVGIVTKEQVMGRLTDMSDIDAYKHVGDELQRLGAFNQGNKPPTAASNSNPAKKSDQTAMQKKRKAASPSKKARATPQKSFNPLSMSDEEIMNLSDDKFL